MAFNPMLVALFLVFRAGGMADMRTFLRRLVDLRRKGWLIAAFGVMPLVLVVEYLVMVLSGNAVPDAQLPFQSALPFFIVFFIGGIGEELGWQGYLYEPLRTRWGISGGGLILGLVWVSWHIIPFFQTHNPPIWVFWQCAFSVGLRMVIVWFYERTNKSVLAAVLIHATYNVAAFMFPNYGSHYDPFLSAVITWIVAAALFLGARAGAESLAKR